MANDDKPRRMFDITVKVGGDSWEDAVRELRRFADHIEDHGPQCDMVSGGYSAGGWIQVLRDPEMTHDRYFEMLDSRKKPSADAPSEGA